MSEPRCPTCGYIVAGLPENRCPECGNTFDPENLRPGPPLPTVSGWTVLVLIFWPPIAMFSIVVGSQIVSPAFGLGVWVPVAVLMMIAVAVGTTFYLAVRLVPPGRVFEDRPTYPWGRGVAIVGLFILLSFFELFLIIPACAASVDVARSISR